MELQQPARSAAGAAPAGRLHHLMIRGLGDFPWTLLAGLAFITFNSAMAVFRSKDDQATVVFVAISYLDLVLLSCCLWLHDRAPAGSAWRDRLRDSIWLLTTLLTFSFAYMVIRSSSTAGLLTFPVALLVWVTAVATGIGASSAYFHRRESRVNQPLGEIMLPPV